MNTRMRFPIRFLMTAGLVLIATIGLIAFAGCDDEPEMNEGLDQAAAAHDHEHGAGMHEHGAPAEAEEAEVGSVTVQETCPIMGSPINEELFVEYQGKKVYFCCAGCPEKFLENPEQYVAKLPQFQE